MLHKWPHATQVWHRAVWSALTGVTGSCRVAPGQLGLRMLFIRALAHTSCPPRLFLAGIHAPSQPRPLIPDFIPAFTGLSLFHVPLPAFTSHTPCSRTCHSARVSILLASD
jgi:hypothetical protein